MKLGDDFAGKLILLVTGFLMTGGLGGYLSNHFSEKAKDRELRLEQSQVRARIGVQVEEDVLGETGLIFEILRELQAAIIANKIDTANDIYRNKFGNQKQIWNRKIYQIRNKVGRSFGADVAQKIYDTENKKFAIDTCGVFVMRNDMEYGKNCPDRLLDEHKRLESTISKLNSKQVIDRQSLGFVWPLDFTSNLRVSDLLVQRVLYCKSAEKSDDIKSDNYKSKCANTKKLIEVMSSRINLNGMVREELADEFYKVWIGTSSLYRIES
jgi:hypothetical protein